MNIFIPKLQSYINKLAEIKQVNYSVNKGIYMHFNILNMSEYNAT